MVVRTRRATHAAAYPHGLGLTEYGFDIFAEMAQLGDIHFLSKVALLNRAHRDAARQAWAVLRGPLDESIAHSVRNAAKLVALSGRSRKALGLAQTCVACGEDSIPEETAACSTCFEDAQQERLGLQPGQPWRHTESFDEWRGKTLAELAQFGAVSTATRSTRTRMTRRAQMRTRATRATRCITSLATRAASGADSAATAAATMMSSSISSEVSINPKRVRPVHMEAGADEERASTFTAALVVVAMAVG